MEQAKERVAKAARDEAAKRQAAEADRMEPQVSEVQCPCLAPPGLIILTI